MGRWLLNGSNTNQPSGFSISVPSCQRLTCGRCQPASFWPLSTQTSCPGGWKSRRTLWPMAPLASQQTPFLAVTLRWPWIKYLRRDATVPAPNRSPIRPIFIPRKSDILTSKRYAVNFKMFSRFYVHLKFHQVIMALGGESSGFVLNSMECYTLGYDGWRCSIPTAVALSGIPEPTQVMPPMRMQRIFPAVCSADYTIFVIGKKRELFFGYFLKTNSPFTGGISRGKFVDSCEFYSVQSNEWISLAPLPVAIHGAGAALPNQVLCLAGGRTDQGIEKRAWVSQLKCLLEHFHYYFFVFLDVRRTFQLLGGFAPDAVCTLPPWSCLTQLSHVRCRWNRYFKC